MNYLDPHITMGSIEKNAESTLGLLGDRPYVTLANKLLSELSSYPKLEDFEDAYNFAHQNAETLSMIFFLNRHTEKDNSHFTRICSQFQSLYIGDTPGIVDFILLRESRGGQSNPTEMFASAIRFHETGSTDSATLEQHGTNVFASWPLERNPNYDFKTLGLSGSADGISLQERLQQFPNRRSEFLERYCAYKLNGLLLEHST